MPTDSPSDNPPLNREETSWLAQYYTSSKTGDTAGEEGGDAGMQLPSLFQLPSEKYEIGNEVGEGGMKTVFRAHDLNASRDVALAKLREAGVPSRRILRFVREARITAALEHPNIVPVHEIGADESGRPYFTMKLLEGETLHSILKKLDSGDADTLRKYPLARLLQIFQNVCNAVDFAHSRGIIHLDLKPANIQVGDFGEVLVLDWGLAKMMDQSEALPDWLREIPGKGMIRGTPGFMAPEQTKGEEASFNERTDIFALGSMLSTMLVFKPVPAKSEVEYKKRGISPALFAVVNKAVANEPGKRYSSVRELSSEIQAFIGGYATTAQQASALTLLWLLVKRHSFVTLLITVSLVAIISILSFSLARIRRSEQRALDALAHVKSEQETSRQIGLIAAPRVAQQAEDRIRALDYDQALQSLDYAVVLDSDLESAWWWKGSLHLGRLEFDQAVDAFDHALKCKYGSQNHETSGSDKLSHIEQVARKFAALARTNRGVLPHAKLAELVQDINSAGRTGWWYRSAALGLFFQRQNRNAPDLNLIEYSLGIMNPDEKDLIFRHQDYPDGYKISIKGAKVESIMPLTGLVVTTLDLAGTSVTDLKWLRDMPLTMLDLSATKTGDLSALYSISTLVELRLIRWQHTGYVPLRPMSQLQRVVVARSDVAQVERDLVSHVRNPPAILGE